jgi:hypothetical protein
MVIIVGCRCFTGTKGYCLSHVAHRYEIWNEQNARVFHLKNSPSFVIVEKIKVEAYLWVTAGAKKLGTLLPEE